MADNINTYRSRNIKNQESLFVKTKEIREYSRKNASQSLSSIIVVLNFKIKQS